MKSISQRLIVISLILAILAAAVTFVYLQSLKSGNSSLKKVTIIVATETIPPRTLIAKNMVKEIQVLDPTFFGDYIKKSSEIVGKYSKQSILKNEGFHKEELFTEGSDEISSKIDSDHRAISINVSGDAGVSQLLTPGDFVDIIVYLAEKKDGVNVVTPDVSKMILQNIEVLAVDKQISDEVKAQDISKGNEKIPSNFLVTLSVKTDDVEKIVLSESIGSIKLALRPLNNDSTSETKGTTREELTVNQDISNNPDLKEASNNNYENYTIKPGDTLRKISSEHYGDSTKYLLIKQANNIIEENLIIPGEIIKIPIQGQ